MEYLSPLDASFLDTEDEDRHASLAIASIAVLDGPAPSQDEFAAAIRGRLPLVPRYRQRVRRVPFNLGRPVWVDDADFDLDFHLRRTALAAPGDDAALAGLVGRIMSQRLDRERPLWEDWLIEGLPGERWALLSKVHHCMIDGVGGNQLYRLVCDTSPKPRRPIADHWQPGAEVGALDLTLDAFGQLARIPFDQARLLVRAANSPARFAGRLRETLHGLAELAEGFTPTTPTSLFGPIGRARRYAVARTPLAEIALVADAFQVTINDVYLAAVAGAFRRLMESRGESAEPESIRTLVPVNTRRRDDEGVLNNRVAAMLLMLPVEIGDPVERLRAVHDRVAELRAGGEVDAGAALVDLAGQEPFGLVSLVVRAALRLPQHAVTTVTTNVPGPSEQLYILGRPIREILPYVPIAERMRIGVSVFTYAGQAAFGVTTDFASVPEADDFAAAIVDEVARLRATSKTRPGAVSAPPAGPTSAPRSEATPAPPAGVTSKPRSEATPAPRSGAASKPRSGAASKPRSGAASKPRSGATSAPRSEATPAPPAGAASKPRSGATSAPPAGAASAPRLRAASAAPRPRRRTTEGEPVSQTS